MTDEPEDFSPVDLMPACAFCGAGTMTRCHGCGRYVCLFGRWSANGTRSDSCIRKWQVHVMVPIGEPYLCTVGYCPECFDRALCLTTV